LDKARATETSNIQNFQMLKQSLEDEIKFANKERTRLTRASPSPRRARPLLRATLT
jgi:hypothetical protein